MSKSPPVSDHAVLSYMQRICGVDTEAIRKRIWMQARSAVGSGAQKTTVNGITFAIRSGHVVSVLPSKALPEPPPHSASETDE